MVSPLVSCARCFGTFGAGARVVRLLDLAFHEVCAPCCRNCGVRLREQREDGWSYDAPVVSTRDDFRVELTEFWCQGCWELGARRETYAQGSRL
jgi:hypothetical protein